VIDKLLDIRSNNFSQYVKELSQNVQMCKLLICEFSHTLWSADVM